MTPGPVAEVWAAGPDERSWACGSGLHLGAGLLLTAGHVVGAAARVQVRLLGADDLVDCRVVWRGGDVDVALVEATAPGWTPPVVREPVRWGRLVTSAPGRPCTGEGFPAAQAGPEDRVRDVEQFDGTINPRTTPKAGLLAITVADPPARVSASRSPWAGMSGAAVFCRRLLTAVVVTDPTTFDRRLVAVPIARCALDAEFRRLVEAATGRPVRLEPIELDQLFLPRADPRSYAALLRADSRAIPFRGRADELGRLREWCLAEESTVSAQVVVGPGGQGKTRLATELARGLRGQGWVAGLVRDKPDPAAVRLLADLTAPALVVVDYAETRPELVAQLSETLADAGVHVRLLLLARALGDWRDSAAADHESLAWLPDAPVLPLGPLEPSPAGRLDAWRAAVAGLARGLERMPALGERPDWAGHAAAVQGAGPRWLAPAAPDGAILGVHVDALASLLAAAEPSLTAASAMGTLMSHERRYWRWAARARGLTLDQSTEENAVAVATLWSAATTGEALGLLAAAPGLRDLPEDRRGAVLEWMSGLYPAAGLVWGTLQPDRLGEHHVVARLDQRPDLATGPAAAASQRQAEHALTVLARAGVDFPQAHGMIGAVIGAAPATMGPAAIRVAVGSENPAALLDGVGRLVQTLRPDAEADLELLAALAAAVPRSTHLLSHLSADLTARLATGYRALAAGAPQRHRPNLAAALEGHAWRLHNLGEYAAAAVAAREAAELFRALVEQDPDRYLPDLAQSLSTLATNLSRLGRHAAALEFCRRYVAVARRLARPDSPGDRRRLAAALSQLAVMMGLQGAHDEATTAAQEAVELYQRLARETGADVSVGLSASLNALAIQQAQLGRFGAALTAAEEAVALRRRLAGSHPDANLPLLAGSLNVISTALVRVGRKQDGAAASQEAVDIFRRAAQLHPQRFRPDLAMSLRNLADRRLALGRRPEALEAVGEAADVLRRIAGDGRERYRVELASVLLRAADLHGSAGRAEQALAAASEAVDVWRVLAAQRPGEHDQGLAAALQRQQVCLREAGRQDAADGAVAEVVAIWRRLAAADFDQHGPRLAGALTAVSQRLGPAGRPEESLAAVAEAVEIYRSLLARRPGEHDQGLAATLQAQEERLREVGRREDAEAVAAEVVAIWRRLAAGSLDEHGPRLAGALARRSSLLGAAGRFDEAVAVAAEAVEVQRRVCAASPRSADAADALARGLLNLADRGLAAGRRAEAVAAAEEAVEIRRHGPTGRRRRLDTLAQGLQALAERYGDAGRTDDAVSAAAESVALWRGLVERDPGRLGPRLAGALHTLAQRLGATGRVAEAVAAARESVELWRATPDRPIAWEPRLARVLHTLAQLLDAAGRAEESVVAAAESVDAWRGLTEAGRAAYLPQLAAAQEYLAERRRAAYPAASEGETAASSTRSS